MGWTPPRDKANEVLGSAAWHSWMASKEPMGTAVVWGRSAANGTHTHTHTAVAAVAAVAATTATATATATAKSHSPKSRRTSQTLWPCQTALPLRESLLQRGANCHDACVRCGSRLSPSYGAEPIRAGAGARVVASRRGLSDARVFLGCSCLRNQQTVLIMSPCHREHSQHFPHCNFEPAHSKRIFT